MPSSNRPELVPQPHYATSSEKKLAMLFRHRRLAILFNGARTNRRRIHEGHMASAGRDLGTFLAKAVGTSKAGDLYTGHLDLEHSSIRPKKTQAHRNARNTSMELTLAFPNCRLTCGVGRKLLLGGHGGVRNIPSIAGRRANSPYCKRQPSSLQAFGGAQEK